MHSDNVSSWPRLLASSPDCASTFPSLLTSIKIAMEVVDEFKLDMPDIVYVSLSNQLREMFEVQTRTSEYLHSLLEETHCMMDSNHRLVAENAALKGEAEYLKYRLHLVELRQKDAERLQTRHAFRRLMRELKAVVPKHE